MYLEQLVPTSSINNNTQQTQQRQQFNIGGTQSHIAAQMPLHYPSANSDAMSMLAEQQQQQAMMACNNQIASSSSSASLLLPFQSLANSNYHVENGSSNNVLMYSIVNNIGIVPQQEQIDAYGQQLSNMMMCGNGGGTDFQNYQSQFYKGGGAFYELFPPNSKIDEGKMLTDGNEKEAIPGKSAVNGKEQESQISVIQENVRFNDKGTNEECNAFVVNAKNGGNKSASDDEQQELTDSKEQKCHATGAQQPNDAVAVAGGNAADAGVLLLHSSSLNSNSCLQQEQSQQNTASAAVVVFPSPLPFPVVHGHQNNQEHQQQQITPIPEKQQQQQIQATSTFQNQSQPEQSVIQQQQQQQQSAQMLDDDTCWSDTITNQIDGLQGPNASTTSATHPSHHPMLIRDDFIYSNPSVASPPSSAVFSAAAPEFLLYDSSSINSGVAGCSNSILEDAFFLSSIAAPSTHHHQLHNLQQSSSFIGQHHQQNSSSNFVEFPPQQNNFSINNNKLHQNDVAGSVGVSPRSRSSTTSNGITPQMSLTTSSSASPENCLLFGEGSMLFTQQSKLQAAQHLLSSTIVQPYEFGGHQIHGIPTQQTGTAFRIVQSRKKQPKSRQNTAIGKKKMCEVYEEEEPLEEGTGLIDIKPSPFVVGIKMGQSKKKQQQKYFGAGRQVSPDDKSQYNDDEEDADNMDVDSLMMDEYGRNIDGIELSPPPPPLTPPSKTRSKMHDLALKHRLISSQNARSHGIIHLSAEEKKTLIQEGFPLPTKLPLLREEEEALKIVRRKIKNKLSAQESRRKRKEYMDTLEKRVHAYFADNTALRQKVRQLETHNRTLIAQLLRVQQQAEREESVEKAEIVNREH